MNFEIEKKIFDIHSAFVNEYSQAANGLSEFHKAITSFFSSMMGEYETQPREQVEENIRTVQDVCFFLKTFCSEIELHTQLLNSKKRKDEMDPDVLEELMDDVDIEYGLPVNPNEIFPVEVYPEIFDYKTVDPSKFAAGDRDEFYISYIKDDASFLFFMMNATSADIVIPKPEFRYDIIPSKGTVFGLLLDGVIFRAVRQNVLQTRPKSFKVLLIDLGEILEITKDYKMYRLTEDKQQTPGQSIYCKLRMDDDNEDLDNENFLRDKLFTRQIIRIDRVYKNMLEVSILPRLTLPVLPQSTQTVYVRSRHAILPPSAQIMVVPSSSSSDTSATFTTRNSNLNDRAPKIDDNMPPLIRNNANNTTVNGNNTTVNANNTMVNANNKVNGNDGITQEELDELYEEPLNTENAMVAVMGYNPQDDRRICRFTDPKTNSCFKGSLCRLEHTTKLKDGWTKDQRIFKSNIHSQMPMPTIGKKIPLFIPYVDDIDKFYGHIVPKNCQDADDLPSEYIFAELNDPKMTAKFKKFSVAPAEFELVFALFDGDWYRAKIMQKFSELEYRVFFVDYGNCETKHINDLRRWEEAFDRYPFQAIECKLDNIIKLKNKDARAISMFEKLVFRKTVMATVTSNAGILLLTIEHEGYDVGEQLCAAQFATPKPITRFQNGIYPG